MAEFIAGVKNVFDAIYLDPTLLTKKCPDVQARLQSQGNTESDGTGNKVTNQEAAFAQLLDQKGFTWIPKMKKDDYKLALANQGLCYIYQVNGTQQSLDFMLMYVMDGQVKHNIVIDCKYSSSSKIFLNDGWFEDNVVYLFTWTHKKQTRTFLGLKHDFTTQEENDARTLVRKQIAEMNKTTKNSRNLVIYVRCANTYSLKNFNDELITGCYNKVIQWITTSAGL